MAQLVSVRALDDYKIELKYDDGLEGEYSCADLLNKEEFNSLNDPNVFYCASIDERTNDVCWGSTMSICKNALHKHLELQRLMKVFKIDLDKVG